MCFHQRTRNASYLDLVFAIWHVFGLLYVPASEYLAYYQCGEKPNVSEVNSVFGIGVNMSWIPTTNNTFVSPPSLLDRHRRLRDK